MEMKLPSPSRKPVRMAFLWSRHPWVVGQTHTKDPLERKTPCLRDQNRKLPHPTSSPPPRPRIQKLDEERKTSSTGQNYCQLPDRLKPGHRTGSLTELPCRIITQMTQGSPVYHLLHRCCGGSGFLCF